MTSSIYLDLGAASLALAGGLRQGRKRAQSTVVAGGRDVGDGGVVFILGATGTGKSKLSIDIATTFPAEVVNSDKMQLYRGLDITTNKMPAEERNGVPHHLLGELDPDEGELGPAGFRSLAAARIAEIHGRKKLPVVAGGSNSLVHALLSERRVFDDDPFEGREEGNFLLRYRSCILWVDVGWSVLDRYLDKRVDEMVEGGMVEELAAHFDRRRATERRYEGLDMAIGVPELDRYFLTCSPEGLRRAVEEIKRNTRVLARRQVEKIEAMGWEMRRLDATEAVRRKVEGGGKEEVEAAWRRDVMEPGLAEVERFLSGGGGGRWRWGRRRKVEAAAAVVTVGSGR